MVPWASPGVMPRPLQSSSRDAAVTRPVPKVVALPLATEMETARTAMAWSLVWNFSYRT